MIGASGCAPRSTYGYLVIIMNTRNRRIERSGVAVVEERSLQLVPESPELQAARIIASMRGNTIPDGCHGQSPATPASPVLRIVPVARRQRATG